MAFKQLGVLSSILADDQYSIIIVCDDSEESEGTLRPMQLSQVSQVGA